MLRKVFILFCTGLILGVGFVYYKKQSFIKQQEGLSMDHVKILFFEDTTLPYIRYSFTSLKGGVDFSPLDKGGLSLLTGYLLDQGSAELSSEELQNKLNYYGTSLSADVGRQTVDLSLGGLSQHSIPLLKLFLKIILEPHFDSKELEILRNQMIESRLKILDDPDSVGSEIFRKELFSHYPLLGQEEQGTIPSLKAISQEDIKKFYQEHYKQAPSIFMVVGHITPQLKKEITDLVHSAFLKQETSSFSLQNYETKTSKSFFNLVTKKDLVQSQVYIGHLLSSFPKDNPREFIALKLGLSVLGGHHLDSRLLSRIRADLGLTYGIYGSASSGRSYGIFSISGATKTDKTNQFIQEALSITKQFIEKGITQEELESTKSLARGYYARQMETKESVADSFVYYHHYLGIKDEEYMSKYLSVVNGISLEEIHQAIKKYIHLDKMNILVYGNPELKTLLNLVKPLTKTHTFEEYFSKELSP